MEDKQKQKQYKALLSEIISKQTIILGPSISVLKARNVPGISVSDDGTVVDIVGDPELALKQLIDQYVELSGQIIKNAIGIIFEKYPSVKSPID